MNYPYGNDRFNETHAIRQAMGQNQDTRMALPGGMRKLDSIISC